MSDLISEIRKSVRQMVESMIKKQGRRGKATNVNLDKCTCDVDLGNGIVLPNVKLKAIEGNQSTGIVIIPKDKSYVVARMVEGMEQDWCITEFSEVKSVAFLFNNGGKLEMKDSGQILLNGDGFGSLIKIEKLVERMNIIEAKHDAFVGEYNAHVHAGNGIPPTATSGQLIGDPTTVAFIENSKVKHGG